MQFASSEEPEKEKKSSQQSKRWEEPRATTAKTEDAQSPTYRTAVVQWLLSRKVVLKLDEKRKSLLKGEDIEFETLPQEAANMDPKKLEELERLAKERVRTCGAFLLVAIVKGKPKARRPWIPRRSFHLSALSVFKTSKCTFSPRHPCVTTLLSTFWRRMESRVRASWLCPLVSRRHSTTEWKTERLAAH